jgi:nucleoside-diphosphate-sugar epimerase
MKIVAVTGATGIIGRFVVAELQQRGVAVRALVRPQSNRGGFAAPLSWVSGDLRDRAALAQLVDGADAVVHLAYEHVPGKYRGGEGADLDGWLAANLDGSLQLVRAAAMHGVERFVFLSSRAVFSRREPGRELDEAHPTSPDTHYGALKVALEAFLQSFSHVEGMRTAALRATGVYGVTWPVERSKWWGLIRAVVDDTPVLSEGGGTEVYGGDVARVVWAMLDWPDLRAETIHLSDLFVTHRDVVRLARHFAGRPGTLPPAPASPPQNPLACRRLAELGIELGGLSRLEATVAELVHLAAARPDSPRPDSQRRRVHATAGPNGLA